MRTWEQKNRQERLSYIMGLCIVLALGLWFIMFPFFVHSDVKEIKRQVTEINENMKEFLL